MKIFLLILSVTLIPVFAQDKNRLYSITVETGAGYSRYFTSIEFDDLNRDGFDGTFRIMWNPEHLLSIGLETGYQWLYHINRKFDSDEFGSSDFKMSFTSVPVALLFSMRIFPETLPQFKFNGGSGISLLNSEGRLYDYDVDNSQISLYYTVGIDYLYPLNNDISLGAEIKFSHYSKIEDSNISLIFLFIYRVITW